MKIETTISWAELKKAGLFGERRIWMVSIELKRILRLLLLCFKRHWARLKEQLRQRGDPGILLGKSESRVNIGCDDAGILMLAENLRSDAQDIQGDWCVFCHLWLDDERRFNLRYRHFSVSLKYISRLKIV